MDTFGPLLQFGAIGGVLVWFMLKAEPRLKRVEEAMDRLNRGNMLSLLANAQVSDAVKIEARKVIREIDARHNRVDDSEPSSPNTPP